MPFKKVCSKADAHGVALTSIAKAKQELAEGMQNEFDSRAAQAARVSHDRGDNNHNVARLS